MEDKEKQSQFSAGLQGFHNSKSFDSESHASVVIKSLDEVKSPFETEAEATILRAIEQNQRERADSALTSIDGDSNAKNGILTGVPASAIHLFEDQTSITSSSTSAKNTPKFPGSLTNSPRPQQPEVDLSAPPELLQPKLTQIEPSFERPTLKNIVSRMQLIEKTSRNQPSLLPPQSSSTPTFRDIAMRAKEMQRRSSGMSERSANNREQPLSVPPGDTDVYERDPETLMLGQVASIEEGDEQEKADSDNLNDSVHRTGRAKRFYRTYCFPCYAFTNFLCFKGKIIKRSMMIFFYLMIPLLGISAALFYFAGNPIGPLDASYSWWLQFLVRQIVTFMLAQVTQFLLIDFIALETRLAVLAIGRMFTLMAMQAKGWPILFVFWSTWNFGLLHGSPRSNHHWLYWQDEFAMFNDNNPSGTVVENGVYTKLLTVLIVIGVVVMIKRVIIALLLGKKKYVTYSSEMTSIMRRVLLISEVALLAQDIAANPPMWYSDNNTTNTTSKKRSIQSASPAGAGWLFDTYNYRGNNTNTNEEEEDDDSAEEEENVRKNSDLYEIAEATDDEDEDKLQESNSDLKTSQAGAFSHKGRGFRGHFKLNNKRAENHRSMKNLLSDEEKQEIEKLLGEWQEPEIKKKTSWKGISVNEILQFRETLNFMDGTHPLSVPFGRADTRQACMASSQKVYRHLLMKTPGTRVLHIDTIMVLALRADGKLQKDKARALIRLFRPDREGNLTLLDFVRSCDKLYKRLKTFQVSTSNSAQLDDAFEQLGNILFYFILSLITLSMLGVDPTQMFLSLTGLFLPLSFLFSSSASKYFEGLLLVVARQPYDIGDRIAVSNPMTDTSSGGSMTWFVEHITLYTTTVRLAATNEVATYSNGSLANLRIINAKRSPQAVVYVKLKFGINVPYQKVKTFGDVIENFVKDRPREWLKLAAFRATEVQADLGYIEYVVVLQHMESWQNIGDVLQSQASVASFCLEVSKKMEMRFTAPPMPVDLSITNKYGDNVDDMLLSAARAHERVPSDMLGVGIDDQKLEKLRSLFATPEPVSKSKKKK